MADYTYVATVAAPKAEVIHHRGPWCHLEGVEYATLKRVDWFNHRRLLETTGNRPRWNRSWRTIVSNASRRWPPDSSPGVPARPGAVHLRRQRAGCGLEAPGQVMKPAEYDAWYDSPRGRWIGDAEYLLLSDQLEPRPGDRVLDVGCGTGWFTRRLAARPHLQVTGVDLDAKSLAFARARDAKSAYVTADACALPFADSSFDRVLSVAALCFIPDWQLALKEIVRVTRSRFAIGALNRNSLLWREKRQDGGSGAYRGAHWHTSSELRSELDRLYARELRFRSAIFLPSGSPFAQMAERTLPSALPWGGFIVGSGNVQGVSR